MYGPFFFAEDKVTGTVYMDMLENFLESMLLSDGILNTVAGWSTVSLYTDCM